MATPRPSSVSTPTRARPGLPAPPVAGHAPVPGEPARSASLRPQPDVMPRDPGEHVQLGVRGTDVAARQGEPVSGVVVPRHAGVVVAGGPDGVRGCGVV